MPIHQCSRDLRTYNLSHHGRFIKYRIYETSCKFRELKFKFPVDWAARMSSFNAPDAPDAAARWAADHFSSSFLPTGIKIFFEFEQ